MTRLRRSLRGNAPVKLSLEDRFEKIISYVKEDNYSEVLRHFNMPSHVSHFEFLLTAATDDMSEQVLTSFQNNNSPTRKTSLETLPTDILLNIVSMLCGNEQIMAALVCKTLAAVVETSTVRKIGNITLYRLSNKEAARFFNKKTRSDQWHESGLVAPGPPPRPSIVSSGIWHLDYCHGAVWEQWNALKSLVGVYLGPKYKFCEDCRKYRPMDKKFWTAFAEYENPGITKKVAKQAPKKKGKQADRDATSAEKVEAIVAKWYKAPEPTWMPQMCPAHELLKERGGTRVLKKVEYET